MICPKCGKEIETNFCPFCGFEFTQENIQQVVDNYKENSNNISDNDINVHPFSHRGRIGRLGFTMTILLTMIVSAILSVLLGFLNIPLDIAAICTIIFATSKRLRDIGWSQWLLLLLFVPILGLIVYIPLLAIPSKQESVSKIGIEKYNKVQRNWIIATLTILIVIILFISFISKKHNSIPDGNSIIKSISQCKFVNNFQDSQVISTYKQSVKDNTTKSLGFEVMYRLFGITMKKSIINPYKDSSVNFDLSNNEAFIGYLLRTNLFIKKDQNTLIDEYGITYKFNCKDDECSILVDINGDEKLNLLSKPNDGILYDQFKIFIKNNKKENDNNIVEYVTDNDGFLHILLNKKP